MCIFCVQVIGMPSKELMEEMGEAEKKRLAAQAEELGEKGLSERRKELDEAVEENEVIWLWFCSVLVLCHIRRYVQ